MKHNFPHALLALFFFSLVLAPAQASGWIIIEIPGPHPPDEATRSAPGPKVLRTMEGGMGRAERIAWLEDGLMTITPHGVRRWSSHGRLIEHTKFQAPGDQVRRWFDLSSEQGAIYQRISQHTQVVIVPSRSQLMISNRFQGLAVRVGMDDGAFAGEITLPGRVAGLCPTGRSALVVSKDGRPEIWDIERSRRIANLPKDMLGTAVFSENGKYLVVFYKLMDERGESFIPPPDEEPQRRSRLMLVEVSTGKELMRVDTDAGATVATLACLDSGGTMILGLEDGRVLSLDTAEPQQPAQLFRMTGMVSVVSVSPDGRFLIAGDSNGHLRFWEMNTGRVVWSKGGRPSRLPSQYIEDAAWEPTGRGLAVMSEGNPILILDREDGRLKALLPEHVGFTRICLSRDGTRLIKWFPLGAFGLSQRVFSNDPEERIGPLLPWISEFTVADDGRGIAASSAHSGVLMSGADGETRMIPLTRSIDSESITNLWLHSGGEVIAIATTRGHVHLVDKITGLIRHSVGRFQDWSFIRVSPCGTFIVAGDRRGRLFHQPLTKGGEATELNGHESRLLWVRITNGSKTVLGWTADGRLFLWEIDPKKAGRQVAKAGGPNRFFDAVIISDGRLLITASWDGFVRLWDLETDTLLAAHRLAVQAGFRPGSVSLSDDGSVIASSFLDGRYTVEKVNWPLVTPRDVQE